MKEQNNNLKKLALGIGIGTVGTIGILGLHHRSMKN